MGKGRKSQTNYVRDDPLKYQLLAHTTSAAKNLNKTDLGGAIFGCNNSTMAECLSKQLFGLPASHFSYVRNIEPGLPLFLFNYSDRKLHGIYEAASCGQMNIDPYAWTDNGTDRTSFPAQVRICIKVWCRPLTENEFKKVIGGNYYNQQNFWFELDHAQVQGLLALFRPSSANVIQDPSAPRIADLYKTLSNAEWKVIDNSELEKVKHEKSKSKQSSANLVNNDKFLTHLHAYGNKDNLSSHEPSCSFSEESAFQTPVSDWEEDWVDHNLEISQSVSIFDVDGESHNLMQQYSGDEEILNEEENAPFLAFESRALMEKQSDGEGLEREKQLILSKLEKLAAYRDCLNQPSVGFVDDYSISKDVQENTEQPVKVLHDSGGESMTDSNLCNGDPKMAEIIQVLMERTTVLEMKQVESERIIQHLRGHIGELESKLNRSLSFVDDKTNPNAGQFLDSDAIYLIGGYDGSSWLSALDSFSPSMDILTPLKSMSSVRSYASAAALSSGFYVFGGGDGNLWYNTVEHYDHSKDEWTSCPPLHRAKGSLSGATLNGKIFAIGGGDGHDCFSDVEMFDPALGRWISNQPMFQKRFATAAAELHGALYAVGGYDGNDYLLTAERLDPREGYWTRLPCMNIRRGCHSLAVLNNRLYVMGGYDGEQMVSSVEIYDPRMSCWTMGEPMNFIRGYAATAVLGDSLLIIGGIRDSGTIVETVECYDEWSGWTVSDLKAIGRRCFFSAIVL